MRRVGPLVLLCACGLAAPAEQARGAHAASALITASRVIDPGTIRDEINYNAASHVVARAGTEWLVAWHDWRFDAEVYSMRLDDRGVPLQSSVRLLSQLGDEPWPPNLATDGTAWLLAWGDCTASDTRVVLTRPGGALERETVLTPGGCWEAHVTWGPSGYLVTSFQGYNTQATFGWFFDGAGARTGGPFALPGNGLASDGQRYLAVWETTAPLGLRVARVEPDGGVIEDAGIVIPTTGATGIVDVQAVGTPAGFAVVYGHQVTNVGTSLRLARITPAGVLLDAAPIDLTGNTYDRSNFQLAVSGDLLVLVWSGTNQLLGRRIPIGGGAPIDAAPVTLLSKTCRYPGGALSGGRGVFACIDDRYYHTLVELDLDAGFAATPVAGRLNLMAEDVAPAVSTASDGGFAAWWLEDMRDGGFEVAVQRMSPAGALDGPPLRIPQSRYGVGVQFSQGLGLLAEAQGFAGSLRFATFDEATGLIGNRFVLALDGGAGRSAIEPREAGGWDVAWADGSRIRLSSLSAASGLAPPRVALATDAGFITSVLLERCDGLDVLGWVGGTNTGELRVYEADGGMVTRLDTPSIVGFACGGGQLGVVRYLFGVSALDRYALDGALLEADAGMQARFGVPAVGFDGRQFVVSWVSRSDAGLARGDLHLMRARLDGGRDELELLHGVYAGSPVVAADEQGHSAIVYEQFVPLPVAGAYRPGLVVWSEDGDAGEADAGVETRDAGTVADDAGTVAADAGQPPPDGGTGELAPRELSVQCGCGAADARPLLMVLLLALRRPARSHRVRGARATRW